MLWRATNKGLPRHKFGRMCNIVLILGHATLQGTSAFAKNSDAHPSNFNEFAGLVLSNVGIGTYLGNPDTMTDQLVMDAVMQSVSHGINVIDTAINYRGQKAERSVGKAISKMISHDMISRDQVFVSTKNGYVSDDADAGLEFWEYVKREYTQPGIIREGEITSGYHCMAPAFLSDQLDRSLANLGLECIDLLYIHNAVEGQYKDVPRDKFMASLESTFKLYEQRRAEGKIKFYGMATWECFRTQDHNSPQYLSLADVVALATKVGGKDHGFRFIQMPFNMYYGEALIAKTQSLKQDSGQADARYISALEAANLLGIGVFTSVPMMQGRLLQPGVMPNMGGIQKPSLGALQFIRSSPNVLAPLVGHKTPEHVSENLEIMKMPPIPPGEYTQLVKKLLS